MNIPDIQRDYVVQQSTKSKPLILIGPNHQSEETTNIPTSNSISNQFEKNEINDNSYFYSTVCQLYQSYSKTPSYPYNKNTNYYNEFRSLCNQNTLLLVQINEFIQDTEEIKERVVQLESVIGSQLELSGIQMKKQNRRCATDIKQNYVCPYSNCKKAYGSDVSLNLHIKIQHNGGNQTERERLAREWFIAQMNNEEPPNFRIQFPPGYLENLETYLKSEPRMLQIKEDFQTAMNNMKLQDEQASNQNQKVYSDSYSMQVQDDIDVLDDESLDESIESPVINQMPVVQKEKSSSEKKYTNQHQSSMHYASIPQNHLHQKFEQIDVSFLRREEKQEDKKDGSSVNSNNSSKNQQGSSYIHNGQSQHNGGSGGNGFFFNKNQNSAFTHRPNLVQKEQDENKENASESLNRSERFRSTRQNINYTRLQKN